MYNTTAGSHDKYRLMAYTRQHKSPEVSLQRQANHLRKTGKTHIIINGTKFACILKYLLCTSKHITVVNVYLIDGVEVLVIEVSKKPEHSRTKDLTKQHHK